MGCKARRWDDSFSGPLQASWVWGSRLSVLFSRLEILRWHRQEERKPHNQDFSAAPPFELISNYTDLGKTAVKVVNFSSNVNDIHTSIIFAIGVLNQRFLTNINNNKLTFLIHKKS